MGAAAAGQSSGVYRNVRITGSLTAERYMQASRISPAKAATAKIDSPVFILSARCPCMPSSVGCPRYGWLADVPPRYQLDVTNTH